MMTRAFAALGALAGVLCLHAGIRTTTSAGTPLYRSDAGNVQFVVNTSVQAGAKNSSGGVIITSDSNVLQALSQAANEWNSVSTASIHFAPLATGTTTVNPSDGINVITIEDNAQTRSIVGDALAVTTYEFLATGEIVDSDIVMSPAVKFSTTHVPGTYDLQAIVSHEMGHALGSDHSGLLSATMFQSSPPDGSPVGAPKTPLPAALSNDDISFASEVYPAGAAGQLGKIQGTVSTGGTPISGAVVVAVSPTSGRSVCALSNADGTYTIARLPADTYLVYAQPLDGPVLPANLASLHGRSVNTSFRTTFYGGNPAPAPLTVSPGSDSQAAISVAAGAPTLDLPLIAMGTANLTQWSWTGAGNTVQAGQTVNLLLTGNGIDGSVTAADVRVLGPGISVRSAKTTGISINGLPALAVLIDIAPRTSRAEATIVVTKGSDVVAYSGGLTVAPSSASSSNAPSFSAAGMKNAASYAAGTVAPGEIFALFGSNLGPGSLGVFKLDAQNHMPTTLGGTQVLFDGVPAPLIYSMAGQVSGVVPYSVSGQTSVVVTYNGAASAPVSLPVSAAVPGLFTASATGTGPGAILNWDVKAGPSLNTAFNAVPRSGLIVAFGTGEGFSYGYPAGSVAGAGPNMSSSVTATIGGVPATVTYAGDAPALITGLFQINVQVPANAPTGAQPLLVNVNGVPTQTGVTVAVK